MKIIEGSIVRSATEGWYSMFLVQSMMDEVNYQEIPDDWVCTLKAGNEPCVGKEKGYMALTRKGYMANRADIRQAFELNAQQGRANDRCKTWADFERLVEEHFLDVEKKLKSKLASIEEKHLALTQFRV